MTFSGIFVTSRMRMGKGGAFQPQSMPGEEKGEAGSGIRGQYRVIIGVALKGIKKGNNGSCFPLAGGKGKTRRSRIMELKEMQ